MGDNYNKEILLKKIMSLDFAINDLTLFLDTHPNERKALEKHDKFVTEYNELKKLYEEKFGPLTIYTNMNEWNWVDEPWPWERGAR